MNQTSDSAVQPLPTSRRRPPAWRTGAAVVIVVVAAILLAILLTYCAGHGGGPTGAGGGGAAGAGGGGAGGSGGRPPITVGTSKASLGAIPIELSALGTVTPLANVNVNARVSGMLDSVAFQEGQMVRAGQLLAQIDPRPFQVALDQAQAQLMHDQALLRDAQLDLSRYRTLKAQDSIAAQQVDTQAALVSQYEATVSADRALVANARLNLSFARITAHQRSSCSLMISTRQPWRG